MSLFTVIKTPLPSVFLSSLYNTLLSESITCLSVNVLSVCVFVMHTISLESVSAGSSADFPLADLLSARKIFIVWCCLVCWQGSVKLYWINELFTNATARIGIAIYASVVSLTNHSQPTMYNHMVDLSERGETNEEGEEREDELGSLSFDSISHSYSNSSCPRPPSINYLVVHGWLWSLSDCLLLCNFCAAFLIL